MSNYTYRLFAKEPGDPGPFRELTTIDGKTFNFTNERDATNAANRKEAELGDGTIVVHVRIFEEGPGAHVTQVDERGRVTSASWAELRERPIVVSYGHRAANLNDADHLNKIGAIHLVCIRVGLGEYELWACGDHANAIYHLDSTVRGPLGDTPYQRYSTLVHYNDKESTT
jgi:hypothetical protein